MKEVEIKAHATEALKAVIDDYCGKEGKVVDKWDQYFHLPGELTQKIRLRKNGGVLEMTTKDRVQTNGTENNLEFEIRISLDQYDEAKALINNLGYEDYFVKVKKGWDWTVDGVHVELLHVNDIGWFLEMEALIDRSSSDEEVAKAQKKLFHLLEIFGLRESDIEPVSYRTMIIGR